MISERSPYEIAVIDPKANYHLVFSMRISIEAHETVVFDLSYRRVKTNQLHMNYGNKFFTFWFSFYS